MYVATNHLSDTNNCQQVFPPVDFLLGLQTWCQIITHYKLFYVGASCHFLWSFSIKNIIFIIRQLHVSLYCAFCCSFRYDSSLKYICGFYSTWHVGLRGRDCWEYFLNVVWAKYAFKIRLKVNYSCHRWILKYATFLTWYITTSYWCSRLRNFSP